MTISRADRSLLSDWWFTVDRRALGTVLLLIATGCILSLAASPAVAIKKGLPPFYFVERHFLVAGLGLAVVLAVSVLSPRQVRRLALIVLAVSLSLMVWVALFGPEIKGARRWVHIAGHSLQPSELGKPALVVLVAWLLAESQRRADVPAMPLAVALGVLFAGLLVIQPDVGQTMLVVAVWGAMLLLSGRPLRWAIALVPVGALGFGASWLAFDHVRRRVARFIDPSSGDNYQVERAIQSFSEGGLFGRGPGEGTIKSVLPDAHTDFIFAVVGEEYGVLACLGLMGLYALLAYRAFARALTEPDHFIRLGVVGLTLLVVLQALINMGVNVGVMPAKGMTLPFISAGGSSLLAMSLATGMLLALMRRRPELASMRKPQLRPTMGGIVVRS